MDPKERRMSMLMDILDRTGTKAVKSRRKRYHTPGSPSKKKRSIKKKSPKKSVKKSMRMGMKSSSKCQKLLGKKISINMGEYHRGRYSSPKQAIAVAYSQVKSEHPGCKGPITKSRKSRRPTKKAKSKAKPKKSVRR